MVMRRQRFALLLGLGTVTGACVQAPPPEPVSAPAPVAVEATCRTSAARLYFDFDGASASACRDASRPRHHTIRKGARASQVIRRAGHGLHLRRIQTRRNGWDA